MGGASEVVEVGCGRAEGEVLPLTGAIRSDDSEVNG